MKKGATHVASGKFQKKNCIIFNLNTNNYDMGSLSIESYSISNEIKNNIPNSVEEQIEKFSIKWYN